MPAATPDNLALLSRFKMLADLPEDVLRRIAAAARLIEVAANAYVFRSDEGDDYRHFLVSGKVDLLGLGNLHRMISADSPGAERALEANSRERWDCLAVEPVTVLRIPEGLLDTAFGQPRARTAYVVRELAPVESETEVSAASEPSEDWMERLLQTPLFQDVPVESLFDLFQKLEPLSVRAGEVLIHQGESGEHCFVLSQGRAEVLRQSRNGDWLRLAEKQPGQIFGEEALLTQKPRNATIRMVTPGEVRRLSAPDFQRLLAAPVLVSLAPEAALNLIQEQQGILLDVRPPAERENDVILDAQAIPVPFLRARMQQLDRHRPIVAFCQDGRLSSVAVFLLRERGRAAWVLKGGVEALRKQLSSC